MSHEAATSHACALCILNCAWCCLSLQVRGPPAKAAFDASGAPTKALEGFCRKAGVSPDAVVREADAKGVEYCWVEVKDAGKPAAEVCGDPVLALF